MIEPEPIFEDDVRALVKIAIILLKEIGPKNGHFQRLSDAIANVETWDQSDDPIENGWVGSDGRP